MRYAILYSQTNNNTHTKENDRTYKPDDKIKALIQLILSFTRKGVHMDKAQEKNEYIPFNIDCYPEFTGKKVASSKRCKANSTSFECLLAVPENDEQAQELYKMSINEIVQAGVKQLGYGERFWDDTKKKDKDTKQVIVIPGMKTKAIASNEDMFSDAFAEKVRTAFREHLARPKERVAGSGGIKAKLASQEQELRTIYAEHGLIYGEHSIGDLQKAMVKKASGKK
jgi:hypothetical protein